MHFCKLILPSEKGLPGAPKRLKPRSFGGLHPLDPHQEKQKTNKRPKNQCQKSPPNGSLKAKIHELRGASPPRPPPGALPLDPTPWWASAPLASLATLRNYFLFFLNNQVASLKDEIFCFAHLRWCHNGWASNILSGGCRRSRYPPRLKYWMPSIMTPSKMGKTKNLIFYSHS